MIRTSARAFTAAILLMAAVSVPSASAQVQLLDVPYLPQSEALCGGAAAAMVMRYWGAQDVYAETFADLVDRSAGGIVAADLLRSLRSRGWGADAFAGDAAAVQAALAARRPAIVLIEDRPGRFHYVVIVGWSAGKVIAHDPARAPFRVLDERVFLEAWKASGFWTLVPVPPAGLAAHPADATPSAASPAAPAASSDITGSAGECALLVSLGVTLANSSNAAGARRALERASQTCPRFAPAWRELAGLDAVENDWRAAVVHARHALDADATDAHAARILAAALFVLDDQEGALDAWNRIGEPLIDLVNIAGLERTRYAVVARETGLVPQQLLTRASLEAARRRLSELPAAQTARVRYTPTRNGRANVDAVVLERPLVPASPAALAAMGLRTIVDRELGASVSSATGGGERWNVAWRWWENRPRVAIDFAAPAPFGGNWGVAAFSERQAYADAGSRFDESRRRAELHVSNWTRTGLRWETAIGIDRWRGIANRAYSGRLDLRQQFAADRAVVGAAFEAWTGRLHTSTVSVRSEWRSGVRNEGSVWMLGAGIDRAADDAPLALWPGAGTGQGRDVLLRAHRLLRDGVVQNAVFGRRLTHATTEWRRWVQLAKKPLRLAPAVFLDTARSARGLPEHDDRAHVDVGTGLRVAVPGSGVLRVDVARGLRDGRTALSIGWGR